MSRTRVASLVLALSVIQIASIQKPIPASPEAPTTTPAPKIAIAPTSETPPIEKPANQERESIIRPLPLTEASRGWILPDSTWKAIGNSLVKLDFQKEGADTYIGLRFEVPFGER